MPAPSSTTRSRRAPPSTRSTATDCAPASRLFSISSFSADAGRSTTSPAAIWLTRSSGRDRMTPTRGMLHWRGTNPAERALRKERHEPTTSTRGAADSGSRGQSAPSRTAALAVPLFRGGTPRDAARDLHPRRHPLAGPRQAGALHVVRRDLAHRGRALFPLQGLRSNVAARRGARGLGRPL